MQPDWLDAPIDTPDTAMLHAARARQERLTKPPGSLGRLEEIGVRLAAMQGTQQPRVDNARICVFAADHGIMEEGVSAFPQAVTVAMLHNFSAGGAAICALARTFGAELEVVDVGAATNPGPLPGVIAQRVAPGTANFTRQAAVTDEQFDAALDVGRQAVARAVEDGAQVFIAGEMGIGNTTSAAAVACAVLDAEPQALAGPGTGLDADGVSHKAAVIARGLARHPEAAADPMAALRCLGGLEISAMTGACIAAARAGLPLLVDGFIATVAALVACHRRPEVADWLFFGHTSAEPGHERVLAALEARPLLDLGMRLGEGSGAATALPLLRAAAATHGGMATFEEAGLA